jgi:hypothetical protein
MAASALGDVSAKRYIDHVKYLASPKLKGRGNDLPELREAARYVAQQFKKCGLDAVNFQSFTATIGSALGPDNQLGGYAAGQDFQTLGISESGVFSGSVVFAGYGITAPEYNYDDYAHLDTQGKIVLVMRHEPQENDEKSVFLGRELTTHATVLQKALNAKAHGAVAMLLVNDPGHGDDGDPLLGVDALMGPEHLGIVAMQVKRQVAETLLKPAGKTLEQIQGDIDKDLSSQSAALNARLEGRADVKRTTRELQNVAATLRGREARTRDQYIIVGAHYDHLGLGGKHSLAPSLAGQIHHGADDNASGTAGILELACSLKQSPPAHSVLFLAFAGEELGLLGSAHYTKTPLIPLEKARAMINLDMIGRPKDRKVYVGGVGTASQFKAWVEEENKAIGLQLDYSQSGYDSSDHTSFYTKQLPVLFFFSGLHADYHKPSDTWEKIDGEGATAVLRLVERMVRRLDAAAEKPLYVRVAEPPRPVGGGGSGYGAYFGSIPDMAESESGVKFADVRAGSPADQAGLKAGDILIAWNDKPVKNLYDFTFHLRAHKPGDQVKVTVQRGAEKLTVDVTLAKRN